MASPDFIFYRFKLLVERVPFWRVLAWQRCKTQSKVYFFLIGIILLIIVCKIVGTLNRRIDPLIQRAIRSPFAVCRHILVHHRVHYLIVSGLAWLGYWLITVMFPTHILLLLIIDECSTITTCRGIFFLVHFFIIIISLF